MPVHQITDGTIYQHVSSETTDVIHGTTLLPESIALNQAFFAVEMNSKIFAVSIIQQSSQTILFCECNGVKEKLCPHQAKALSALIRQEDLQAFFNPKLRHKKLQKTAYDFGLENEPNLDNYFQLELHINRLLIKPINPALTPVTRDRLVAMRNTILRDVSASVPMEVLSEEDFVVLKPHKYYKHLQVDLCQAPQTKQGRIKNPITSINTQELIWAATDTHLVKFLMGVHRLQHRAEDTWREADIAALRAIAHNPLNLTCYHHDTALSETLSATSLTPVHIKVLPEDIKLIAALREGHYEVFGSISIKGTTYNICELPLKFQCFLIISDTWYLIDRLPVLNIVNLLQQQSGSMVIHPPAFREYKEQFLDKVADQIRVEYAFIPTASPRQLTNSPFLTDMQQLIYLSDFGSHVMIIPVMRYSDVEIPVRTKRQIYGLDQKGKEFLVERDIQAENKLTALLVKQHPDFPEQLENELDHFYLHKRYFLHEEWFLPTFEEWGTQGITVLGFNELEGNKINPHKIKISIQVTSGLNWFNAAVDARFGSKKAAIKKIQVAVKNKSKYIQLDDGTLGILPQEWLEKFEAYFTAGDITEEDLISIPKVNFSTIEALFDAEMLDETAREDIRQFQEKVQDFKSFESVEIPQELQGTLRSYQHEGLNWLNFLDDYNFGGCLADDMGLGKSIQIIAFILLQRQKAAFNTNLLVVPTTLIFNWQAELSKFAPNLRIFTLQGADRVRSSAHFEDYEVILLSYNTLLSDISYLKNFQFNYLFLDESQQIKNPESQRYKAARLLQARNRIAITGTPIENNTFDLYSQFSFACPGLFGSKQHFKELYSAPIDKFKSSKRASELQQKIQPFLLRRTKQQVAKELPEKTEVVLYCQMEEEQRKTYDAYEKEFREYISATKAEELEKRPMHVLKGLTKLRQICNSTKLLKSDEVLGLKTSSKIEALMEQIENNAPHHKMLVFSQFVSMLELIREELTQRNIGHTLLTGSTRDREATVTSFQENEDKRVFLISLKAGGTGLNLVEASYVYLVDPWWNPAVENQAIDRVHRIGQAKKVTAIRLICPDTVEEKILELQSNKKALTNQLVTEDASFFKSLSKEGLMGLLQ